MNALRTIFSWPKNCSTKLIKLITGNLDSNTMASRMAQLKSTTELTNTYKFLCLMSDPEQLSRAREQASHRVNKTYDMSDNFRFQRRKHFNPEKLPTIQRVDDLEELMNRVGPIWTVLDRKRGSMTVELLYDQILQKKLGRHADYPIGYFNTFALIQKLTSSEDIEHRNLVIAESSSILMALENYNNHDWRLIKLREAIFEKGWRIYKIDNTTHKAVNEHVSGIYRSLATRQDHTTDNFETWQMLMEEATSTNNESTTEPDHQNQTTTIESISEPYLGDYKERNKLNRIHRCEDRVTLRESHTSLTRLICSKPEVWQNITPNWIDGSKMLMLSGLIETNNGQLIKGCAQGTVQCPDCEEGPVRREQGTRLKWYNITQATANLHPTLHRALICHKFDNLRSELDEHIGSELGGERNTENREGLERCLKHRSASQRVLRYLTRCAMLLQTPTHPPKRPGQGPNL